MTRRTPSGQKPGKGPGRAQEAPGIRGAQDANREPGASVRGGPPVRDVPLTAESLTQFVRSGGTLTLAEWVTQPPEVQALLADAGTMVRAEHALAVASAILSPDGYEAVAESVDGGMAADEVAVRRALALAQPLLKSVPTGDRRPA